MSTQSRNLGVTLIDLVENLQEGLVRHPARGLLYVSFNHVVGFLLKNGICGWQSQFFVKLLDAFNFSWICKLTNS